MDSQELMKAKSAGVVPKKVPPPSIPRLKARARAGRAIGLRSIGKDHVFEAKRSVFDVVFASE